MKASLQPKEAQIEDSKEKLLELEDEYEKQVKEVDELSIKLLKYRSKISQLQLDLIQQKQKTDEKYKVVLKFCQDVYKIVQQKDPKAYK